MSGLPRTADLWVIGAGRVGLALGLLLWRQGSAGRLSYAGRNAEPPPHPLFAGTPPPARYAGTLALPAHPVDGILLAVPDAALPAVAERLAAAAPPPGTPVLHLSGVLGAEVLRPLAEVGCATGGLHPLAAVADPIGGAERLRGAWWGVEADGAALRLAEWVAETTAGRMLRVAPGAKAQYHAAAVFASNYVVALLGTAEQLMDRAGADPDAARAALASLAAGAVGNVEAAGPVAALTGPVLRGDAETLRLHLDGLSEGERSLYLPLARAALRLARQRGMGDEAAQRIERMLEEPR